MATTDHTVTAGRNKPTKPNDMAPGDVQWLRFNLGKGNSHTCGISLFFGSSYMQMDFALFEDDKTTPVKDNNGNVVAQNGVSTARVVFSNPLDRTPAGYTVPGPYGKSFQLRITKGPESSPGPFGLDDDFTPYIDHH